MKDQEREKLRQAAKAIETIAVDELGPDAQLLGRRLLQQIERFTTSNEPRISIIYAPQTRSFAKQFIEHIQATGLIPSSYSLAQAVDLIKNRTTLDTDWIITIETDIPDPEVQCSISMLNRVFGKQLLPPLKTQPGGTLDAANEAVQLSNSVRSRYEQLQRYRGCQAVFYMIYQIQIQQKVEQLTSDELEQWKSEYLSLKSEFEEAFIPKLKRTVAFRLEQVFPKNYVSPVIRDLINSIEPSDLKTKGIDRIFDDVENACVSEYTKSIDALCRECEQNIAKFMDVAFRKLSPRISVPIPDLGMTLPGVQPSTVTKPNLKFDTIEGLKNGLASGLYPVGFALISALETGGLSLLIPVLVGGVFAANGLRTGKVQHEKQGIETIRLELQASARHAGDQVSYSFENLIEEGVKRSTQALSDIHDDYEKRLFRLKQTHDVPFEKQEEVLMQIRSHCNEIINILGETGADNEHG